MKINNEEEMLTNEKYRRIEVIRGNDEESDEEEEGARSDD